VTEIVIGADFSLSLAGVRDAATGAYLNSATVAYALATAAGAAVPGGTGSLSYVADSSGDYTGAIESTVTATLAADALYSVTFTIASGAADGLERLDLVAKPPGGGIVNPELWEEVGGTPLTAANRGAVNRLCLAVASALARMCYPRLLEPLTLTLAPFDAPCRSRSLFLPAPVRAVSAVYYHCGAGGDAAVVDPAADLLTPGTDYRLVTDDRLTGWSRSGELLRLNRSAWGEVRVREPGRLAYTPADEPGAVFVTAACGPTTVDDAVRLAAVTAVTALFERRTTGAPLQSESWAGYSKSVAGAFAAEAAIRSPEVTGLLRAAGVLPIHVG
jgi:hypothetical protein